MPDWDMHRMLRYSQQTMTLSSASTTKSTESTAVLAFELATKFRTCCNRFRRPCVGPRSSSPTIVVIAMTLLSACGIDAGGRLGGGGGGQTGDASRMVVVPVEEAAFVPVRADLADSPEIAVLWGDPATGSSAMLMRLRRGSIPMHAHSSDYHLIVLEGTMKHWDTGDTEATASALGPGSYWFQPADLPHAEACLTELCLLHVIWEGARDVRLVP